MIGIDKYAYQSQISKVNPRDKIIFSILPLILCIFLNSFTVSILTIIIMIYATLIWGSISYKVLGKMLLIPLGFLIIGSLTIMINRFPIDTSLLVGVKVGSYVYGISLDTFKQGILVSLKSLGAVSCMYFFSLNTPMNDLFNFLRKTKLPILVTELMELMYRFIFVVWDEAMKMRVAQTSRLGYYGLKNSITSCGDLVSMLFIRAFKRVDRINSALESRGYDGSLDTLVEEYESCKWINKYSVLVCGILIISYILERKIL